MRRQPCDYKREWGQERDKSKFLDRTQLITNARDRAIIEMIGTAAAGRKNALQLSKKQTTIEQSGLGNVRSPFMGWIR